MIGKITKCFFSFSILFLFIMASQTLAQPQITALDGTMSHGNVVTVNGLHFGSKSAAAPMSWDNAEDRYDNTAEGSLVTVDSDSSQGCGFRVNWHDSMHFSSENRRGISKAHYLGANDQHAYFRGYDYNPHGVGFGNQEMYITWYIRTDASTTANNAATKLIRLWAGDNNGRTYRMSWTTSQLIYTYKEDMGTAENPYAQQNHYFPGNFNGAYNADWKKWYGEDELEQWHRVELYFKASSAPDVMDGRIICKTDNRIEHDITLATWLEPWDADPDYLRQEQRGGNNPPNHIWVFGVDPSKDIGPYKVQLDDIYIDNTIARVELGNSPNFQSASHCEIQIPSNWTDDSISFQVNQGAFAEGDTAYLFVFDQNGNVNDTGYPVTLTASQDNPDDPDDPDNPDDPTNPDNPVSGTITLVDFGASESENSFGLSDWNTVMMDVYTGNAAIGPGGTTIRSSSNGGYNFQGVQGTAKNFAAGDKVKVTWYNNSDDTIIFKPRISFDDPDRRVVMTGQVEGTWTYMSEVTIAPHDTAQSVFEFDETSAGTYSLVNVNVNKCNHEVLICDKIELEPLVTTKLLVDFGASALENTFGVTGWDTVMLDVYTGNAEIGPGGTTIRSSSNGGYNFQGVQGSPREFTADEKILVTWYNNSDETIVFKPRISFDDPDRRVPMTGQVDGTWTYMSEVSIAPHGTAQSEFKFDNTSSGTFSIVNVNVNKCNHEILICDKIEIDVNQPEDLIPVASFETDVISGIVPLTVNFENTSINEPTYYRWDFNDDGVIDFEASNPQHTFTEVGTYKVSMTAGNENGENTITREIEVRPVSPVITSVVGVLQEGSIVSITGTNFGSGPDVVLFDNFESGITGQVIKTGPGSATIGQWNKTEMDPYYTDTASISGTKAFQADQSTHFRVLAEMLLDERAADGLFVSWWLYIPTNDNVPGEGVAEEKINWKQLWVQGSSEKDDDVMFPAMVLRTGKWIISGNDCAYSKWLEIPFVKGEWKRFWGWLKPGADQDGSVYFWVMNSDGVIKMADDDNVSVLKPAEGQYNGFEKVFLNGFGRQTPNCHPTFDDVYIAVGGSSKARVEIGNAPNYENCTDLSIITPNSWNDNEITATVRQGRFSQGDQAYLFVFDQNGLVNEAGYPVSFQEDVY